MAKELLTRKEVNEAYTWDLTGIYRNGEEYQSAVEEVQRLTDKIAAGFKGKLSTAEAINQCLDNLRLLYQKLFLCADYSYLALSVDQTDEESQKREQELGNIFADIQSRLSFIRSEIIQADEEEINRAIESSKENKGYLEEIMRQKPHMLHPEAERTLSALSNILNLPSQVYDMAKLADMDFGNFVVEGKEYPLSFVLFEEKWVYEPDRKLRHAAFEAFSKKLREYQYTIATAYQSQVQKEKILASLRGYDSVFDSLLFEQKVDREIYDRQIDLIMDHLAPHMRKYAGFLKEVHGLEEMTFADLKLDPDPDFEEEISIEEGEKYIERALSVLGDDYLNIIKRAFKERWIDFVQNKGKSTGAFCMTPYGSHPFILLSWTGSMRDVFTLAHELGHAGHFYLTNENQNIFDTEPSLYFVEAPSTMNEMLLANYLIEKIEEPQMKRRVLSLIIGGTYYHNFVTHLLEAHFQREVYKIIDRGGSLQASLLHQLKRETLEKFWGDAVKINEGAELTWMRQPHYYMGLYPYTYSAGLTIATEVSRRILREGQKAIADWLEVLKAGGTRTPVELAMMAGVDIRTDQPLLNTIEYIGNMIEEIIKLSDTV
ncbi:MAG: oligoendopeptidase F [Halanaerobiaceae bacterium]|nr:oligoendopeptidase F [Halanaerobiaceae bacterium]